MKIKILKDIPGYNAGEVTEEQKGYCIQKPGVGTYNVSFLIATGFAEEIKDDINIEAIRQKVSIDIGIFESKTNDYLPESKYFKSYLTVKAVIDQLNGDWEPDWKDEDQAKVEIYFMHHGLEHSLKSTNGYSAQSSVIPPCKDEQTALKLIELVPEELKVLFEVK